MAARALASTPVAEVLAAIAAAGFPPEERLELARLAVRCALLGADRASQARGGQHHPLISTPSIERVDNGLLQGHCVENPMPPSS